MALKSAFEQILSLPMEEQLVALESLVWQSLLAGSKSSRHPWNLGAFTTLQMPGMLPATRTVVLRQVDREARQVECHSDLRAGKVREIAEHDRTCWLFYEHSTRIQLRLSGASEVFREGEFVDEAWRNTSLQSRSAYLSRLPPGIGNPDHPFDVGDREVAELEQSERGRDHFCVVRTRVESADWLYLRREGHLRSRLVYAGEATHREWVNP